MSNPRQHYFKLMNSNPKYVCNVSLRYPIMTREHGPPVAGPLAGSRSSYY